MAKPEAAGSFAVSRWELYAHGADVGIRGAGASLAQAFEGVGLALTSAVCDLKTVEPREPVSIRCDAYDVEGLLFDWVNALVYEMATSRMLFSRFQVTLTGNHLEAQAWGEPLDAERHQPAVEVKGATYTDLRVFESSPGQWTAQCIVDV